MSVDRAQQFEALQNLIRVVLAGNDFYRTILHGVGIRDASDVISWHDFSQRVPMTTKAQLAQDQLTYPPYGTNLSMPMVDYIRYSQTSGTTGQSMRWLDTSASWQAMVDCWQRVFLTAGCERGERVMFAFSFGPFLGFWTAFESATQLGYLCIPGGGMSSELRLKTIRDNGVTTLCCTPTYAVHLGQVAQSDREKNKQNFVATIERIILAGEPGGSVASVRSAIERLWPKATVYDHHGMTEVGPVTYQDGPGRLRVMSDAFFAEVVVPETGQSVAPGERGELVLTTLARTACPVLRYRTGDLVCQDVDDTDVLVGGILGRVDDMVQVRGVNVYPSAIDAIVRGVVGVAEYQVVLQAGEGMTELTVRVEATAGQDVQMICKQVAQAARDALQLRVPVVAAESGALPRHEFKARRWVRES